MDLEESFPYRVGAEHGWSPHQDGRLLDINHWLGQYQEGVDFVRWHDPFRGVGQDELLCYGFASADQAMVFKLTWGGK